MNRAAYPTVRPTYGTYEWLQREIGVAVGIGANYKQWDRTEYEKVDSVIQRGIRRFYQPALTGQQFQRGHRWSFLYPKTTLTTSAAYSTGTVEVVAGVATITGGTWPSWAADGDLTVSGVAYEASSVAGADLTLKDTTVAVAAGTSYTLSRPRYTLPSDYGGIDGPMTYRSGTGLGTSITVTSEQAVRERRQPFQVTGYPQRAAVYPATPDADDGTRWEVTFYPSPDIQYIFEYRYRVVMSDLVEGDYPLGGIENAETVLASCLAVANPPAYEERFLSMLAASINADQSNNSPDNLGQNLDRSDQFRDHRDYGADYLTPYNGAYYD